MSTDTTEAPPVVDDGFDWPPSDAERAESTALLKDCLSLIEGRDQDYEARYALVLTALAMAAMAGLKCGFRLDPAEPDWPVAYIELPTGQVSWHMPAHTEAWDGHTTEEKYARIKAYVEGDDCDGTPAEEDEPEEAPGT